MMLLNDILVLLDRTAAAAVRLDLAIGYARKQGAWLKGMALQSGLAAGSALDTHRLFCERAAAAGVSASWQENDAYGATGIAAIQHAMHASGLVIVGQTQEKGIPEVPADLPERLVLAGGRPVITVPYAGRFTTVGERVLIAWNDGRESTRAVHDALPILRKAQRVHLVKLITEEEALEGAKDRLAMIIDYLGRAGVRVKGDLVLSLDFPPGDMLLNRACEDGSDLLVMGAYGFSGGGKPVLGSMAKHILRHMTVPVLMSH
jgi:nucleotide-binding universal stress UspA family protein